MTRISACRGCGEGTLLPILDLGEMPLANDLRTETELDEPQDRFPLELVFCPECSLVQITEDVSSERLFREYVYFSSYSDTMREHVRELTEELVEEQGLDEESFVVEVASNDGYLLQYYRKYDIPILGVEPARNVAEVAREERDVPTLTEFFDPDLAEDIREEKGPADVVHMHNVLAHVPEPTALLDGACRLLHDDGVAVVEVPYVRDLVDNVEFDTIYHEHRCYFSLTALQEMADEAGLQLLDVRKIPLHGGSLQVRLGSNGTPSDRVDRYLAREVQDKLTDATYYTDFADRVRALREALLNLLDDKASRRSIAAYGASAKGAVLLNYLDLDPDMIDYVVDRNPTKQGRYMPGLDVPIRPPEELQEDVPDHCLLLAWNYAEEVLEQQEAYIQAGGRFIRPIPEPEVVP